MKTTKSDINNESGSKSESKLDPKSIAIRRKEPLVTQSASKSKLGSKLVAPSKWSSLQVEKGGTSTKK